MEFINENSTTIYYTTITTTIIALALATGYTLRNILRIWQAGNPKPVDSEDSCSEGEDLESEQVADEVTSNVIKSENTKNSMSGGGDFKRAEEIADIDPMEYCDHIQSEVKKARQRVTAKKLQQNMSIEDLQQEQELQRRQLGDIFKMMEQQNEKFGVASVDDVQSQMKLYA